MLSKRVNRITVNATAAEKVRWESAAEVANMRLQDWIRMTMDRQAIATLNVAELAARNIPKDWEFCHHHSTGRLCWAFPKLKDTPDGLAYAIVHRVSYGRFKARVFLHDSKQRRKPSWEVGSTIQESEETMTLQEACAFGEDYVFRTNRGNGITAQQDENCSDAMRDVGISNADNVPEGWQFCRRYDSKEPRWVFPKLEDAPDGYAYAIVSESQCGGFLVRIYLHDSGQRRHLAWETYIHGFEGERKETKTLEEACAYGEHFVRQTNRNNGLPADWVEDGRRPTPLITEE